jgi:hypothetical protein
VESNRPKSPEVFDFTQTEAAIVRSGSGVCLGISPSNLSGLRSLASAHRRAEPRGAPSRPFEVSGSADPSGRAGLRVPASARKQGLRADRHDAGRVDDAASRAAGDERVDCPIGLRHPLWSTHANCSSRPRCRSPRAHLAQWNPRARRPEGWSSGARALQRIERLRNGSCTRGCATRRESQAGDTSSACHEPPPRRYPAHASAPS